MRLLVAVGAVASGAVHGGARAGTSEVVCFHQDVAAACPDEGAAIERIIADRSEGCPSREIEVVGVEEAEGVCCYEVTFDCTVTAVGCNYAGRPLLVRGRPVRGASVGRGGFCNARLPPIDPSALTREEREQVATHWMRVGAAEYGSVAGFYRFALDLMANGAPAELIVGAHRAAAEEIHHARLAFTLASRFAGGPVGPGPLGFPDAVPIHRTLDALALATIAEGCTIETLSACLLREALERATEPAVVAALRKMARDEDRHAELAWRTVRWALSQRPSLHATVEGAFESAILELDEDGLASDGALEAYGLLSPRHARGCLEQTVQTVIRPCARALLSASA